MSVGGGARPTRWLTVAGAVVLLGAVGLPVGSWAIGLALILIVVASLATIVGLKDAAKGFGEPILVLLAVGLGAPMLAAMARTALADPGIRVVAAALVAAAVVGGIVLLIARAAAHPPEKHAPHRPTFRRHAAVVDPEPPTREPVRRADTPTGTGRRGAGADDLDLFGGPHARR